MNSVVFIKNVPRVSKKTTSGSLPEFDVGADTVNDPSVEAGGWTSRSGSENVSRSWETLHLGSARRRTRCNQRSRTRGRSRLQGGLTQPPYAPVAEVA